MYSMPLRGRDRQILVVKGDPNGKSIRAVFDTNADNLVRSDPMPDLEPYRTLKDRDLAADGLFIGEGKLVVERMIAARRRLRSLLVTPRFADHFEKLLGGDDLLIVRDEAEIADIAGFRFHRGVMACAERPAIPSAGEVIETISARRGRSLIVVCSNIESCENMGAIIRSAAAFGVDAVLVGGDSCDPFSRRALKVSAGTVLTVRLGIIDGAERTSGALSSSRFRIVGTADSPDSLDVGKYRTADRTALVLGNEARGLTGFWAERCDEHVRIPLAPGIDSLNVAVAAGVLIYALSGTTPSSATG
jgi:tRNA G18 (ribose-2'-O)-methylase SpoU